jgi:hypothetical protein
MTHKYAPTQDLINAVKTYALDHYTDGGWDVVVETMDDHDIVNVIAGCSTLKEALAEFEPLIDVWSERQADARREREEAGR